MYSVINIKFSVYVWLFVLYFVVLVIEPLWLDYKPLNKQVMQKRGINNPRWFVVMLLYRFLFCCLF